VTVKVGKRGTAVAKCPADQFTGGGGYLVGGVGGMTVLSAAPNVDVPYDSPYYGWVASMSNPADNNGIRTVSITAYAICISR